MKAFFNVPEKSSGSLVEVKQSALQPHEDFLVRSFVPAGFHGEDSISYRLAACSIFMVFFFFFFKLLYKPDLLSFMAHKKKMKQSRKRI